MFAVIISVISFLLSLGAVCIICYRLGVSWGRVELQCDIKSLVESFLRYSEGKQGNDQGSKGNYQIDDVKKMVNDPLFFRAFSLVLSDFFMYLK